MRNLLLLAAVVLAAPIARAQDGFVPELPADLTNVVLDGSATIRGCTYTVGSAERPGVFLPPTYVVFVLKEPARDNADCDPSGYALVGESTIRPTTELAVQRGKEAVVVAFTVKETFSGAGFIHSEIVHLSSTTGEILHRAVLAALPPVGTGTVTVTDLQLRGNGTLIVVGTKNGVIPGEVGAGDQFRAVYTGFLFDDDPTPSPTSVVAF